MLFYFKGWSIIISHMVFHCILHQGIVRSLSDWPFLMALLHACGSEQRHARGVKQLCERIRIESNC